jgi:hypothetical protein
MFLIKIAVIARRSIQKINIILIYEVFISIIISSERILIIVKNKFLNVRLLFEFNYVALYAISLVHRVLPKLVLEWRRNMQTKHRVKVLYLFSFFYFFKIINKLIKYEF